MAIIKCKMCGGDIVLAEDKTYGTCEYCGSTMTFPKVSDEQRLNLFNRANHFRRQNEFDKAIAAYDKILDQDDTDAEAHWGAVLSRYGIEYVEDPVTHERIPTCHRVQLGSILTDADYLAALEHAPDTRSRDIYESEAKRIADIQKGILAISAQEKPYDVFICYKETDDNGSRTKDSTLAQDIYYQLTNEGYKVFFSRITLEDKLGQQYEPYIFAALNSAKVMLVIGTKPEYFNAVWVKNEWNRYLDLMKRDRNKLLIPCYRDMDPYDLPEELSALQSQDMSKIGFMQDIIRGVKKVLNAGKDPKPEVVAVPTAGPGVASLHKRAVLFLEDGDWDSASEYFDRILDIDPEYAPAYIGKVQVTNKVRKEDGLARCSQPLKGNPDYQKALRFASEQQKAIYEGYNRTIEDRLERERKEAIYREADAFEKRAATEADFLVVAKKFDEAGEIRDARERAANCRAKAASAKQAAERQAEEYRKQLEREREERKRQEEEARKEAERKAEQERIEAEKRAEQERIEAEIRAKRERYEAEKRRKRNRIIAIAMACLLVVAVGALVYNNKVIQPKNRYNAAQELLEKGEYEKAASSFAALGDYSNSAEKVQEVYYSKATVLLNAGDFEGAKECFLLAGDYSDAAVMAKRSEADKLFLEGGFNAAYAIYKEVPADYQIHEKEYRKMYNDAKKMADDGKYDAAMGAFLKIASYRDAETQAYESQYSKGLSLKDAGEYDAATWVFADLVDTVKGTDRAVEEKAAPAEETNEDKVVSFEERFADVDDLNLYIEEREGYRDSLEQARECRYLKGAALMSAAQYDDATRAFVSISSYKDAADQARQSQYEKAKSQLEKEDYKAASRTFRSLGEYSDAASQAESIAHYLTAETCYSKGDYHGARPYYAELGDYLDSAEKLDIINRTLYAQAAQRMKEGDIAGAYETYSVISDYSDSADIMAKVDGDYQSALDLWEKGDKAGAETALVALAGWSDADVKLEALREEIADDAVAAEDYDTALTYYAKLKDQTEAVTAKIINATKAKAYQEAEAALGASSLKTAYAKFVEAGDYSDATDRAAKLEKYIKANEVMATGAYADARATYLELGDYLDSQKHLETCNKALYDSATTQMENGDIAGAYETFTLISGYEDSAEITAKVDSDYQAALDLWEKGDKTGAETALMALTGWNDVDAKLEALREEIADDAVEVGDYNIALAYYAKLGNRTEELEAKVTATTKAKAYEDASAALASGDLETAYAQFTAAGDHEDAREQATKLNQYMTANADMEAGQYMKARTAYKALGDYLESVKNLETCNTALYQEASALMQDGDIAGAYVTYSHISDYSDSSTIAEGIKADYDVAAKLLEEGKYDEANAAFLALKNFSDSGTQANESLYRKAVALAEEGQYAEAATLFDELGEYSDSNDKASEAHYNNANTLWQSGDLQGAVGEFEALGDYADAPQLLTQVNTEIANKALEEKDYATALTAYQHLEQTEEIKAKEYELAQACYDEGRYAEATSAYETLGQYELSLSKLPIARYAWADQLFNEGSYAEAAAQFTILGEMTDSAERAKESTYQLANQQLEAKEYDIAKATFQTIKGYSDADTMAEECDYRKASDMLADSEYKNAQTLFEALGTYSDSATKAKQCVYEQAEALYAEADYAGAEKLYSSVDYEDSADKAKQCVYNRAELLFAEGDYAGAAKIYGSVEYEDSAEKAKLSTYNQAEALFEAENYAEAKTVYASVDYEDSKDKAKLSAYREAEVCYAEGSYADAEKLFAKLGDYSDSADRAKDCHVQQGNVLMQAGDYAGAIEFYESVDYGDSAILAAKCHYELGKLAITSGDMDAAVSEYAQAAILPKAREALLDAAKDYAAINEMEKAIQALWVIREDDTARNMLKEIGDLKAQTGETGIAVLAYCVLDDKEMTDLQPFATEQGRQAMEDSLSACKLLPGNMDFSGYERYVLADSLFLSGQYDSAIKMYEDLGEYSDASEKLKESLYRRAGELNASGNYEAAYEYYTSIAGYKDADILVENVKELSVIAWWKKMVPGETVAFGTYEQDANTVNGKEAVEWIVLENDGDKAMLISKYVLDCKPYNDVKQSGKWESSTLRTWLNEDFLNEAFSPDEQSRLATVLVPVQRNPKNNPDLNSDTKDKVFLLSTDEAESFIGSELARACQPTEYAKNKKVKIMGNGNSGWWLRLTGKASINAPFVNSEGVISRGGASCNKNGYGVRPAIILSHPYSTSNEPVQIPQKNTPESQNNESGTATQKPTDAVTTKPTAAPSPKPTGTTGKSAPYKDGNWYVSNDGVLAARPVELKKRGSSYTLEVEFRQQELLYNMGTLEFDMTPDDSGYVVSLPDKDIVESFQKREDGGYSIEFSMNVIIGSASITMVKSFGLSIE